MDAVGFSDGTDHVSRFTLCLVALHTSSRCRLWDPPHSDVRTPARALSIVRRRFWGQPPALQRTGHPGFRDGAAKARPFRASENGVRFEFPAARASELFHRRSEPRFWSLTLLQKT